MFQYWFPQVFLLRKSAKYLSGNCETSVLRAFNFMKPSVAAVPIRYKNFIIHMYPLLKQVEGGYTVFTLSICVQNRVCSVSSTILTGLISNLHTLSSNFRRCVACNKFFLNSKIWSFDKFFKFVTLTLSCFYLGSNMNCPKVWAWNPIWTAK